MNICRKRKKAELDEAKRMEEEYLYSIQLELERREENVKRKMEEVREMVTLLDFLQTYT